jgi:predicted Fe-Mo cluster-binding NifX family protein
LTCKNNSLRSTLYQQRRDKFFISAFSIVRGTVVTMLVLFPSEDDTGTLSNVAKDFETARYYTIANIIEGTLADTKIKAGYASPPPPSFWGPALSRMKIQAVVVNNISPDVEGSIKSSGIKVVKGVTGLVGDAIDWIADVGIDEVEEMINLKNSKQTVVAAQKSQGQQASSPG